ncbi:MAG: ABC transporter substrate-binding protein, partial [Nitrospinaceae bacterium]|nr:ABC transporter substrate-binding protein [Nitrospinaceae bacterium]
EENLNLFPMIAASVQTIYLNGHPDMDTPFKDERVRQALDYCLDREILAKALYGELGIPMYQGYNPDISPWGFADVKGRKRDITKAKALLSEAGYPNGLDVEFKITPTNGKNDLRAQIIQQMAKPAGFRLNINSQVGVQYWSNLRQYTYQMMMWSIYHEDPMNFYYIYLHTDPDEPYNGLAPVTGIKDPEIDLLLDKVAEASDLQQRKATFKKVVQRAIDKAYWLPNTSVIGSIAWSNRLQNFNPWSYFQPEQAFTQAWVES